jgi:hypothetical protein
MTVPFPELGAAAARNSRAWLVPSLPELLFAALLLMATVRAPFGQALLGDGDTGWHIRTGELILASHAVPHSDPFSFSRWHQPWIAWEWLSDVLFAAAYRWGGLRAVVTLAATVLCAAAAILFAWLLHRGVGLWIGLVFTLAATSASSMHYLARPHIFSLLLFPISLWLLEWDRASATPAVWWLVPLSALWANLHAGFAGWLSCLGLLLVIEVCRRDWARLPRHGAVTIACFAASLVNPYGWRLHEHIFRYLGSSWILNNVQEFQSPQIRSENMIIFALLLLGGAACAPRVLARGQWFEGLLVWLWGFAALRSARHAPIYAVVAAPVLATECALLWTAAARRATAARILWEAGEELGRARRFRLWPPILALLLCVAASPPIADFPKARFPIAALAQASGILAPPGRMPRILTSDVWGGYLIFRLFPRQRVFFDGRSDFYGPGVGADYLSLFGADHRWPEVLDRYAFEVALLPLDWPLATALARDPGWRTVYRDEIAVVLVRQPGIKKNAAPAEATGRGT